MARISKTERYGLKQVWQIFPDGHREFRRDQLVPKQTWSNFTRDDVRRNPMNNVTRWRSPSVYNWNAQERAGWYSDGYYCLQYPNYPITENYYVGALDDSFAQLPSSHPDLQWPPYPGALVSRAEMSCLQQARDMKVNLATSFAEGKKAVDGIASRTNKVLSAYLDVRKGNWKKASKSLGYTPKPSRMGKGAANDWLELQYGWLPLLNDIYGLHQEANRQTVIEAFRFGVRSTVKEPFDRTEYNAGASAGSDANYSWTGHKYYKCRLDFEVSNNTFVIAGRIGLLNPAEVAWELVPYSFVADWFVPVGDWLSCMTAALGLRFCGGSGSRGVKYAYWGKTRPNGTWYSVSGVALCSGTHHSGGRGIYTSSPMPLPYLKNPLSTTHVTNAIALVTAVRR